jgi:hypothetical protein
VPAEEARHLDHLIQACNLLVPQGAPILDLTNRPALFFFLDRPNATPFYQVALMEPFQDRIVTELRTRPPAAVLLTSGTALDVIDGKTTEARVPKVLDYVRGPFARAERVEGEVWLFPSK